MTLSLPDRMLGPEGEFADTRGRIVALPSFRAAGALLIESRAGAVRGNHFHRLESHLMYVVSGEMVYLERDAGGGLSTVTVGPQQAVITPPGVAHATYFPTATVMVVLSDVDRRGTRYEDDVVRVVPLDLPGRAGA